MHAEYYKMNGGKKNETKKKRQDPHRSRDRLFHEENFAIGGGNGQESLTRVGGHFEPVALFALDQLCFNDDSFLGPAGRLQPLIEGRRAPPRNSRARHAAPAALPFPISI